MFEPKIYKKNGLEAFRLVGNDGSEFFYEGAIDCNETEIFKDAQGRLYYPVTVDVGGATKYYVELEPTVPQIPVIEEGNKEKEISRLVNASPRVAQNLPEDIFVNPESPQEILQETKTEAEAPQETPALPPETQPQENPEIKEEAAEAIQSIFSRKAGAVPTPSLAQPEEKKPKKKSLKLPIAIALIIILLAAGALGIYMVKPGAFKGLTAIYPGAHSTPTPVPTPIITPTPEPTATPTPVPTPVPGSVDELSQLYTLIDFESPGVMAFVADHTNASSAGNQQRRAYDLFNYVNGAWNYSENASGSMKASEIATTLEGNSQDYSVLMCALTSSLDFKSRIVVAYNGDAEYYYPEILVANTSAGFTSAQANLSAWYGVSGRTGHSDDDGNWISLAMGTMPGKVPESTMEYAIYTAGGAPKKLR